MHGRLGRYELVSRIGAGGTAETWLAQLAGSEIERAFVLKRLLPELARDRAFVERLRQEARLLARMSHANIAQVVELFEADGETVLVLEHVEGADLLTVLREQRERGAPLPVGLSAYIAREIARGLAYAHTEVGAEPIVHRDVSPSNVMLGVDGVVRLIDFGIAKARDDAFAERTATGVLLGKRGYLAPEQLVRSRHAPDPRTDQFSLGVVLHEMLTGRRLRAEGELATEVTPPSRVNAAVSPALDALCLRMLATEPAARYASCAPIIAALDEIVHELGSGPTDCAARLAYLGLPRPLVDPTTERHTEDAADATATVHDAPRVRLRSWLAPAITIVALVTTGLVLLRHPSEPAPVVAPLPSPPSQPAPLARPATVVVPPAPVVAPAEVVHKRERRHHAPSPRAHVHDGSIFNPF